MERTLYDDDHEAYRETVREFLAREVVPYKDKWDDDRWITAGGLPGGRRGRALRAPGPRGVRRQRGNGLPLPAGRRRGDRQGQRHLVRRDPRPAGRPVPRLPARPGQRGAEEAVATRLRSRRPDRCARDDRTRHRAVTCRAMRTSAKRDGDHWIVNGQKTFISSGIMADLIVLAVRTDPDGGSSGFSLLMVEADSTPGFERGPQARQDRPAGPGHLRAVLHRRSGAGGEPTRRGGPGTALPDEPPPP